MKKSLLSALCMTLALALQAQVWTAPAVPAEELGTLNSTDIVYIYNVEADAFAMYGMAGNTEVCATRLTNGDYAVTIPQQHYVFVANGQVRMRNKEKGNSSYISCKSDNANSVVMNANTNPYFTYAEVEEGSRVYT